MHTMGGGEASGRHSDGGWAERRREETREGSGRDKNRPERQSARIGAVLEIHCVSQTPTAAWPHLLILRERAVALLIVHLLPVRDLMSPRAVLRLTASSAIVDRLSVTIPTLVLVFGSHRL